MEGASDFFMGIGIFGLFLGLAILVLYIWSIFWAYRDAERRGSSAILVTLMVAFLAWPMGIVVWLLIRPGFKDRAV